MTIASKIVRELKRPFTRSRQLRRSIDMLCCEIASLRAESGLSVETLRSDLEAFARSLQAYRERVDGALQAQERDRGRIEAVEISLRFQANMHSGVIDVPSDSIDPIKDVLSLLEPHCAVRFNKIRMGAEHDGGYVMLDDFTGISAALSLGVGGDMTWDLSVAERDIVVLQFDDAINAPPIRHELCTFWPRKIVATSPSSQAEVTIESILLENNLAGGSDLLLKMDIEGDEWEILGSLDESVIGRFRQIVCEFHDFHRIGQSAWRLRAGRVFEKLARTHGVIHVHGNNGRNLLRAGNIPFPEVLEITFVRRRNYEIQESRVVFPTELDSPNDPHLPDIFLGAFKFR